MDFSGIEKFSLVDFDNKISATLFFAGCNCRCPFCHNISLVLSPQDVKPIPFKEILEYLDKRKGLLDAVVITGGEPTLMPDLIEKIRAIKEMGFLVKLDSNGTNPDVLRKLIDLKLVDYFAMDIKNCLEKYSVTVGVPVDIDKICESIQLLMNSGVDYEFRTTVIREYHTINDMKKIGQLIKGAKKMRIQKFIPSDTCINPNLHSIDEETAKSFVSELKKTISNVALRGY